MYMIIFAVNIFVCAVLRVTHGHGMMLDPPNRSSVWRYYPGYPVNYNDNSNFCGGMGAMHYENGGKCGVCGDNYADPHPQANEHTGAYGQGLIVGNYISGEVIEVTIRLTANHDGFFQYSLCKMIDEYTWESEDCFIALTLEDGSDKYHVSSKEFTIVNRVKIPSGFTCEHCVLRWYYKTGNSWGTCDDGTGAMGCGAQETYRNCADISIA